LVPRYFQWWWAFHSSRELEETSVLECDLADRFWSDSRECKETGVGLKITIPRRAEQGSVRKIDAGSDRQKKNPDFGRAEPNLQAKESGQRNWCWSDHDPSFLCPF
jgi:hypothetical protein